MNSVIRFLKAFLFSPISATGFGAMRVLWAFVALLFFSFQWTDIGLFYSAEGILTPEMTGFITRESYRVTALMWVTDPAAVTMLYLLLLVALTMAMIGILPRLSTIISTLLIFSFHEANPLFLGGGDTVLRVVGFLLCIAPELRACSLERIPAQWAHFRTHRTLLPKLMMPAWPMRLLLWQLIVLYGSSLWFKFLGTMWLNGTAVASALHHPMFARFPKAWMDAFAPLTSAIDAGVILFHIGWILLLVPRGLTDLLPAGIPRLPWKRTMLLAGVIFHGGIFILMDAGSFSLAMMAAYCGCLTDDDIAALRTNVSRLFRPPRGSAEFGARSIAVLYDGQCGLCLRSAFALTLFDTLHHVRFANFRNERERMSIAPHVTEATLDRAMHVIFPSGITQTGFDGFRALAWHLPLLWPLAPALYLPGVAPIGRAVYARIADRRKKCDHEECRI